MSILPFVLISALILLLFGLTCAYKNKKNNILRMENSIQNYKECLVFKLMPNGIDEHERYIISKENLYLYIYNCITAKLIKTEIKKISKCELVINDTLVQTVNSSSLIGRAIVGGVLFGGVGAIIGGVTSSKTTKTNQKVERANIVIYYDDLDNPIKTLTFNKGKANIEEEVMNFHATLCACMAKAKNEELSETIVPPLDIRQCPFCAEDIKSAAIICKHCGKEVG